jgi:hypothetical protein
MTIDLRREAEEFRRWLELKVSAAVGASAKKKGKAKPVGAVVALYCYVQDGWIALDFNTDDDFEFDGDVSKAAWKDLFARPQWQAFAELEGDALMGFVEADGSTESRAATEADDDFLAGHFGKMIADTMVRAHQDGVFTELGLRPGCVLSVNDFYGNWGWEGKEKRGRVTTA